MAPFSLSSTSLQYNSAVESFNMFFIRATIGTYFSKLVSAYYEYIADTIFLNLRKMCLYIIEAITVATKI